MKPKIVLLAFGSFIAIAVCLMIALGHRSQNALKLSAAIHSSTPVAAKAFIVHGTVRNVDVANGILRVAHEEIPNYMPAMTMPFTVKDPALLNGLKPSDRVQFELAVTENDSWISHIEKLPSSEAAASSANSSTASLQERETESLQSGEVVPDFQLVDQDGKPVRLSDFRGKAVVMTFIYTRCPLPNFCPLMSKNFSELEQRLSKEFSGKYHLLSVTMDPDFDRPEVLKDYAGRYEASARDWSFATGTSDQIKSVAGLVGLYYARENGLITHDLRTALIGPDGRLVHLWKSNVWTPYEVQRMVRETLTGNRDFATR
jgi:protein SCO1/2